MAWVTLGAWLFAGVVVAALLARQDGAKGTSSLVRAPLHVALWPLFVPVLLPQPAAPRRAGAFAWDERIRQAELSLAAALDALGKEVEDPLSLERARVAALGRAMRNAAARVGDLEGVLALPEHDLDRLRRELARREGADEADAVVDVLRRRLEHVERLTAIRRHASADLERALAEAAALATRLTVLRYEGGGGAGTAGARARELTDTVDELCRVLAEARAA